MTLAFSFKKWLHYHCSTASTNADKTMMFKHLNGTKVTFKGNKPAHIQYGKTDVVIEKDWCE